jgi:hypothetical protein
MRMPVSHPPPLAAAPTSPFCSPFADKEKETSLNMFFGMNIASWVKNEGGGNSSFQERERQACTFAFLMKRQRERERERERRTLHV